MKNSKTSAFLSAGMIVFFLGFVLRADAYSVKSIGYSESFEGFEDGTNIVEALGWEGEEVLALVTNYPAPSFPIATNHATIAKLVETATIHVDGSPQANGTLWVDYLVSPTRWEEDEAPSDIPEDAQLAMYVDTNGFLNIYHADNGVTSGYPEYSVGVTTWSVIDDPAFHIPEGEWIRLSVQVDYRDGDYSSYYFQVLLNGATTRHANAHYDPAAFDHFAQGGSDDGELGSWFPMATQSGVAQLNAVVLRGSGLFDDFVIRDSAPVVSNIFYYHIAANVDGTGVIEPAGNVKVLPNQNQAFTYSTQHGYFYNGVTIDETFYSAAEYPEYSAGYTFNNVTNDGSITAHFAELPTFIISASADNGVITPSGDVTVIIGDDQPFSWTNNYGYVYDSVTVGENGETNIYTLAEYPQYESGYTFANVQGAGSIVASFTALDTFDIVASAIGGTIDPDGTVAVPVGYDRNFTWYPDYGNTLESVEVVENGATNMLDIGEYPTGYTFNNVTEEGSITVTFTALPRYSIEASAVDGTISPSGTVSEIVQGENRAFTYAPAYGYRLVSVTVVENGDVNELDIEEYPSDYTFYDIQDEGSITATFEEIPWPPGLKQWLEDTGLGLHFEMTTEAWKAYIASTDPNDPEFAFEVSRIWKANGTNYVQWKSIYVDPTLPPFGIYATTNMMQALTQTGSYPRVAGTGSEIVTNTWSEAAPAWPVYYRVVATNNPPEEEEP